MPMKYAQLLRGNGNCWYVQQARMNYTHAHLPWGVQLYSGADTVLGYRCGSDSKEYARNAGDRGLIPRLVRSPGEENGYPVQYSCLENPIDRGASQATVHGITKKVDTAEQLTLSLSRHYTDEENKNYINFIHLLNLKSKESV